jgi:hypothetical protein
MQVVVLARHADKTTSETPVDVDAVIFPPKYGVDAMEPDQLRR